VRRPLLLLLLVAASLRLAGITFGLDFDDVRGAVLNNQVDERGMVVSVQEGLLRGHLHPGDFLHRGPGAYYLLGAIDAAVLAARAPFGGGWAAQLARLEQNSSLLHLLHRLVSAAAGVLTVALLVRVCHRELGRRTALLAGALLAVGYLHVRESHFGTVDVLWGLFTLLTVDQALLLVRDPSPRRYALTGLLAGLTTAVKYFGALLVAHLVVAHFAARAAITAPGARPGPRRLLLGLLCVGAGFALLSPFLLFAAGDLVDMVGWSVHNIGADPSGGGLGSAIAHHARWTLAVGMGEPAFVLALAGLVLGWRRGGPARLLAVFALLLLPCLLVTGHHPVRFGVAPVVLLTPLAALATDALLSLPALRSRAAQVAVLALVLAPSVLRSVAFDRLVVRPDTRPEMLRRLDASGAAQADIVGVGLYGLPRVQDGQLLPFTDLCRRILRGEGPTPAELEAAPPRFILRDLSSGLPDSVAWDALAPLVARRYREALVLEPRPDPSAVELPDHAAGTPTHMIPFGNPWAMTRPGAALVLYERTDS